MANQRRRKTFIHSLHAPSGPVTSTKGMIDICTHYYNNFSFENRVGFTLHDDFFSPGEKVPTNMGNENLTSPFTEEEVKFVVLESYFDGAPLWFISNFGMSLRKAC